MIVANSIGNLILKNIKGEHFLIKVTCDEMWRHMEFHDVPRGKRDQKGKIFLPFTTSEIKFRLNFSLEKYNLVFFDTCTYQKISLKKHSNTLFLSFLKNSTFDLGLLKSKFFKSEIRTKFAIKKSSYDENFKSLARKLWI